MASHGFAVVAVDHPLSTMFDVDRARIVESVNNRPTELRLAVDATLSYAENNPEGLTIQGDAYVVSGHSLGTQTAFALAGGKVDIAAFLRQCEENTGLAGCDYREQFNPDDFIADHHDPRVIGLLPLSPGFWHTFGENGEGLNHLVDSLSLVGDRDPILNPETEIFPSVEALGSPKQIAVFSDTGHYGFSEMCDFAPFLSEECTASEDNWADISNVQAHSNTLIVAYVGWMHTGQAHYKEWLMPEKWENSMVQLTE